MLKLPPLKNMLLLFVLVLWTAGAWAKTILVLGDSISAAYQIPQQQGWVNLLQQHYDRLSPGSYRVVNASLSGDTTAQGLRRLPALLKEHQPDQLIVELGGNDGLRGLSLDQMRSNLQDMITLGQQAGAEVVLLSVELPASYGVVFKRRYQDVFDQLAATHQLRSGSLGYALLADRELIQDDGIHPTAEAQPLLLKAILPLLSAAPPLSHNP